MKRALPVPIPVKGQALLQKRTLPTPPPGKLDPSKLPFFYGNLDRSSAEHMVSTYGRDCLMLRASSVKDCFALTTFSKAQQTIMHYLVYPRSNGGFSIQDSEDTNTYPSLTELVAKSPVCAGCVPLNKKEEGAAQPSPSAPAPAPSPVQTLLQLKANLEKLQQAVTVTLASLQQKDALEKNKEQLKNAIKDINPLL
jgi:hypothetical protein